MTVSPTADPELATLTIPEAAAILHVSHSHLYRLAKRGELPGAIHLGAAVRIHKGRLMRWLESGEAPGASTGATA